MRAQLKPLSDDPGDESDRLRQVVDWWNALRICGDSGAATWEEIERLEREVTDCLAKQSPDVNRAESLTAYAMLLIAGCSDL
jgi:hypothetical protein